MKYKQFPETSDHERSREGERERERTNLAIIERDADMDQTVEIGRL